jgi:hypothetical protein
LCQHHYGTGHARLEIEGAAASPFHITSLRFNKALIPSSDTDGDGVPDAVDRCVGTIAGVIVNNVGCSLAQLVPCGGLSSEGSWKNHGQYVVAFVKQAEAFQIGGAMTEEQKDSSIAEAASSSCGK